MTKAYICAVDTVFQGVVASWRDEDGKPILYPTKEEAEADANEACEREPEDMDEDCDPDEPDMVLEVIVTEEQIVDAVNGRVYWSKDEIHQSED